ncbi:carbohydrate ABC transporter permease [Micromonospora sp. NBC_01796]|uniref:carbohydrate ABC transporter permease n=1 Tax=Micromonospora sp. NBC_01796 TaxID=2975987 RepID=UPI002DD7C29A|nr:sugar ABC transporter permease [Micromonospora sp. NBC_01796]WSA84489.1 sugar ABC transporter permease [Micromonospora sp. NBC_01796]
MTTAAPPGADQPTPAPGPVRAPAPVHRQPTRARRTRQRHRPLWMLIPGGLLTLVVIVVPLLTAGYISLLDLDQYSIRQWVGAPFVALDNYVEAVSASHLPHAIGVSLGYALLATVLTLPLGVAAALATHDRFRGRALVRSIFLIPYVLPAFVVGTVWRIILQPDGVANAALGQLGFAPGLWLNGPRSFWALVIVQVWTAWPLVYLLAVSGLHTVDPVVHEAAALDGAGWWAKLRYVIGPYLRGPVSLALVISFLHHVNNFTLPFVLFGVPAPRDVEVLPVLTYVESFQNFRFGLSAAMAVLSLVLVAIPIAVYLRAVRLDTGDEGRTP